MNYSKHFNTRKTKQTEKIPGMKNQVKNRAGGYVFEVDTWKKLNRFLLLGTEGGTYYVKEKKLTIENAENVLHCIEENGIKVVDLIVKISTSGRAAKNEPALFALAIAASLGDEKTKKYALDNLSKVARIGTHLFHFLEYLKGFRGWGRGLRKAIASWYNEKPIDKLTYQAIKYQQRDGWSHRDALRLSHPIPTDTEKEKLYRYITNGYFELENYMGLALIEGYEKIKRADKLDEVVRLISEYKLTWEMVPTQWLREPEVWKSLLPNLPLDATVRNLGRMGSIGLLKPFDESIEVIGNKFDSENHIRNSRLHPLAILLGMKTYSRGCGIKGDLNWPVSQEILDILNKAYYKSFETVEPTGKKILIGIDVSHSMTFNLVNGVLQVAEAAAAMAMTIANTEKRYHIIAYDTQCYETGVGSDERLDSVLQKLGFNAGGTDCAKPILYATKMGLEVDAIVIITDNETWAGSVHPIQALNEYRQKINPNVKLIVVGMTAYRFSIAPPDDLNCLDVVGFDTSLPILINEFIKE